MMHSHLNSYDLNQNSSSLNDEHHLNVYNSCADCSVHLH